MTPLAEGLHDRLRWQWEHAVRPILNVGCESDPARLGLLPDTMNVDIDLWEHHSRFIRADARGLPFSDKSYGCVILAECIDHMTEPRLAVSEALRVAKEHVLVTVSAEDGATEHPDHWRTHIDDLRKLGLVDLAPGDAKLRHGHYRQWTRQDLEILFATAGARSWEVTGPHGQDPSEWRCIVR